MKIIYWMVVLGFLMGCGQGKVSVDKQKESSQKESKKEAVSSEKKKSEKMKKSIVENINNKKISSKLNIQDPPPGVSTKKEPSPYLTREINKDNFIKNYKIDVFEVPIHLTGAFAWSSEKAQREIYKEGYRSPLYISELYPGIMYYTKWVQHNPESKNVTTEYDKLEYYDEQGNLLNTYDVDDQNPYLEKYPNLINNFYNAEGNVVDENSDPEIKEIYFRSSTNSIFVDKNTGFTQIGYILYNSNKHGNTIDFKSTFIVLDTLGNEINRLVDKELYINDSYVTPDGKFLALCTGGMVDINDLGNDMNGHRDMGILIYDLTDMSLIYENKGRYSDGISSWEGKTTDMIYFRLKNDEDDEIYDGHWYIIDPINQEEYYRLFTDEERQEILKLRKKVWKYKNYGQNIFNTFNFKKRTF